MLYVHSVRTQEPGFHRKSKAILQLNSSTAIVRRYYILIWWYHTDLALITVGVDTVYAIDTDGVNDLRLMMES